MTLRQGELRFYGLRECIKWISEKVLVGRCIARPGRRGLVCMEPSSTSRVTYGLTLLGQGTSELLAKLFY